MVEQKPKIRTLWSNGAVIAIVLLGYAQGNMWRTSICQKNKERRRRVVQGVGRESRKGLDRQAYMYFGIRLESVARQESRVLVSGLDGLGTQAQALGRSRDAGDGLQT
jgi:hypothetical protein